MMMMMMVATATTVGRHIETYTHELYIFYNTYLCRYIQYIHTYIYVHCTTLSIHKLYTYTKWTAHLFDKMFSVFAVTLPLFYMHTCILYLYVCMCVCNEAKLYKHLITIRRYLSNIWQEPPPPLPLQSPSNIYTNASNIFSAVLSVTSKVYN